MVSGLNLGYYNTFKYTYQYYIYKYHITLCCSNNHTKYTDPTLGNYDCSMRGGSRQSLQFINL